MSDTIRFRLLVFRLLVFHALYKALCIPVGLLVLSAAGLLLVQHYWMAMFVLTLALLYYEGIYWLFIGRWTR